MMETADRCRKRRKTTDDGGSMLGAAEDDGLRRKRAEAFGRRQEMRECTYYNRVFGRRAEVMRIILPLTELLTVPGHAGSRSRQS